MIGQVLAAFVAVVVALAGKDIYHFIRGSLHPFFSPLRLVPGPRSQSLLMGNLRAIIDADPCELHAKWAQEYGPVIKYKGFVNHDRLCLVDARAVGHILAHPMEYQKPGSIRHALSNVLGNGLLVVEGKVHKQQRRVMSPAFGIPQIRELTGIFVAKSIQLRDIWSTKLQEKQFETNPDDPSAGKIEVQAWLNKMTLDVIGLAGFNYSFDALNPNEGEHELNGAMRTLLTNSETPSLLDILHVLLPATRVFKSKRDKDVARARATLDRVGKEFIAERKAAVLASAESKVERKDIVGKDLLSLLVRDNLASDIPEDSRMTDDEILAQVPTFLLAGHETTSTAVTWVLYALSQNREVQDKLRAELRACDGDEPSMETLDRLSYLDCVVRETMRLYCPVSNTLRVAMQDDVIPTEKEWIDTKGVRRTGVQISKGDSIFLPFLAFAKSEEIWGPDAKEWKPERWSQGVPQGAANIPGIWGNTFAFSGGARACIGYRFSVIEMKAIIYTLVRAFRFSMSVDVSDIKFKSTAVTRPFLKDKIEEGPQLPLWVSLVDLEA